MLHVTLFVKKEKKEFVCSAQTRLCAHTNYYFELRIARAFIHAQLVVLVSVCSILASESLTRITCVSSTLAYGFFLSRLLLIAV